MGLEGSSPDKCRLHDRYSHLLLFLVLRVWQWVSHCRGAWETLPAGYFLIFKPYNVGDLIEAQGHLGVVKEVQIFNTILLTPSNKRVIIPNGAISNGSIVNYSAEGILRVDLVIGIAYEADIPKAKEVLYNAMADHDLVLKDPGSTVAVSELADSSVNLVVRPWCKAEDYWQVYFDITEAAKASLESSGVTIPFPQRDVHLYEHKAAA